MRGSTVARGPWWRIRLVLAGAAWPAWSKPTNGHRKGDDGGCFAAALGAVRRWGGVLEHSAYTDAWAAYGIPAPHAKGGWQRTLCGGATCHIDQGHYGHRAKKPTWIYAVGCNLPEMRWGPCTERRPGGEVQKMSKRQRSATPLEFRDLLLGMARSATQP